MTTQPSRISADLWIAQLFGSRAAVSGGIVRRSLRDIDRIVGRDRLLHEVDRRGYFAVLNAGQVIVFCNSAPVRRLR